ncbi:MAG TPA: hypothetical protein VJ418_06250 [Streptosporangiaceae bacterium]|nr:hypothetical protein [Streptosporangiaceae bacterium]
MLESPTARRLVCMSEGTGTTPTAGPSGTLGEGADVREGLAFTKWMAVDDAFALGQLHGRVVTLAGQLLGAGSVVDGSFPSFNSPAFSPALPNSDAVNIVALDGNKFTLVFAAPVRDPVFHFASFASVLSFLNATTVQKLSGDDTFTISGVTISGVPEGTTDSNGTVRVIGEFRSLVFSARKNFVGGSNADGIYLQIGGLAPTDSA